MFTHGPLLSPSDATSAYDAGAVDSGTCITLPSGGSTPSPATVPAVSCLPSLVCVGMAKAGTDELRGWLSLHPNLSSSTDREVQYFNHGIFRAMPGGVVGPVHHRSLLEAALRTSWSEYAARFPVPREHVGRVLTFEKSPGYARPQHNLSRVASGIERHVPFIMRRLMPSVLSNHDAPPASSHLPHIHISPYLPIGAARPPAPRSGRPRPIALRALPPPGRPPAQAAAAELRRRRRARLRVDADRAGRLAAARAGRCGGRLAAAASRGGEGRRGAVRPEDGPRRHTRAHPALR